MPAKHLLEYLTANFSTNNSNWTSNDIINHFMEQFGVDVKIEEYPSNNLYLFKYGMIEAKWQFPITHECRGIILRNSNNGWEVVSSPFKKFFNNHEGHCPIFEEEKFKEAIPNLSFTEKADGTCITLWFDKHLSEWRISTLGSITTVTLHDSGVTFDQLFWRVVNKNIIKNLVIGNTYLFELCTKLNRVVTRYPSDRAYVLGVRDATGHLWSRDKIKSELADWFVTGSNIFMLEACPLSSLNITDIKSAIDWVENQRNETKYGEYSEGFVVVDDVGPVCKMKNSVYLALHHSLSDAACTRKAVIASFFQGTMDDLYAALPEEYQKSADTLKDWFCEFKVFISTEVAYWFRKETFNNRKEYALFVQTLPEHIKMFSGFFYSNQEAVCNKDINLGDVFTKWIQTNWEKYDDFWKKICYE